jgi:hypothetical protein
MDPKWPERSRCHGSFATDGATFSGGSFSGGSSAGAPVAGGRLKRESTGSEKMDWQQLFGSLLAEGAERYHHRVKKGNGQEGTMFLTGLSNTADDAALSCGVMVPWSMISGCGCWPCNCALCTGLAEQYAVAVQQCHPYTCTVGYRVCN